MAVAWTARMAAAILVACFALPAAAAADDVSFVPGAGMPIATGASVAEIEVADVDGDGADDVVYAMYETVGVRWGRTDGSGGLDPGPTLTSSAYAEHIELADVDGDTHLDVIAASDGIKVFKNNGNRTFDSSGAVLAADAGAPAGKPVDVVAGMVADNLDGDVEAELAVTVVRTSSSDGDGYARILDNNGSGTFSFVQNIDPEPSKWAFPGEIVVGRFDGAGGDKDLAFAHAVYNEGRAAVVLRDQAANTLTYTLSPDRVAGVGDWEPGLAGAFHAADLDGDDFDDLVSRGSIKVAWGDATGSFSSISTFDADHDTNRLGIANLAGDGKPDLVGVGTRYNPPPGEDPDTDDPQGTYSRHLRVLTHGATPRTFALGADVQVPATSSIVPISGGDFDDDDTRDDLVLAFDGFEDTDADGFDDEFTDDLWTLLSRAPGSPNPFGVPPAGGGSTDTGTPPPGSDPPPPPGSGPPMTVPPGTQPPGTVVPVRANQIATLPPQGKRPCGSRRNFRIRLRRPPEGVGVVEARVLVNGKRVKVVRGARLTAPVDLRGFPRGRAVVTIRITLADGRVLRGKRVYRPCATKKRKGRFGRRRRG